jgi:dihydropteroate synthase
VSPQEELDRVLPVIERLGSAIDTPVSVDTSKPAVMREAIAAGAAMINDVCALRTPEALETAAELAVPVCLMHMQGEPRAMQRDPQYHDVVDDVVVFLRSRIQSSLDAGVLSENLIVDPGFGFGKTLQHNLRLLEHLDRLVQIGYPVVVGMSRKSMIGHILGDDTGDWLAGSITLAVLARQNGAHIIRVHDVGPTVQALRVLEAAQAGI